MKVALVHDWLTAMRGGEKCLEAFCELFPTADVFALVHAQGAVSSTIEERRPRTSWLQRLPRATRWYRYYLPLVPLAAESLDVFEYDLVLSNSSCAAKGIVPRPDALHVSYTLTPMRYAWDLAHEYFPPEKPWNRILAPPLLAWLRAWDVSASARVDRFVADSRFVAQRIRKYYRREADVVPPPIDTTRFAGQCERGDAYLIVSALVPNKGVDLAVRAFNELGRPLVVVGSGALERSLKSLARPNVRFAGWVSDEELVALYRSCRALVHPAIEDFGMAPLEAAAAGKPTIALGAGGSLETVVPLDAGGASPPTGLFFEQRDPAAIADAVRRFEANEGRFDEAALRAHAKRFDRRNFLRRMSALIDESLDLDRSGPIRDFARAGVAGGSDRD